MKIFEIIEARRNPDKNPKKDFELELHDFYQSLPDNEKDSWFVHFSSTPTISVRINKPTLEPGNISPLGIYAYPLSKPGSRDQFEAQNYAHIFQIDSEKTLDAKKPSPIPVNIVKSKTLEYLSKKFPESNDQIRKEVNNIESNNGRQIFESLRSIIVNLTSGPSRTGYSVFEPDEDKLQNKAKILNVLLRYIGYESIQNLGRMIKFESVILSSKFIKQKKIIKIGQEYKQHPNPQNDVDYHKSIQKKFKNADKKDTETGEKTPRYPNPFTGHSGKMDGGVLGLDRNENLIRYVKNAINHVKQGKQPPSRKQAEDMMGRFFRKTAPRQSFSEHDNIEILLAYKHLVLDPLNLKPLNPDLQRAMSHPYVQDSDIESYDLELKDLGIDVRGII